MTTGRMRRVDEAVREVLSDAVFSDLEASRAIYNWVVEVCKKLGAADRTQAVTLALQRGIIDLDGP